jgi:hypothetical protein
MDSRSARLRVEVAASCPAYRTWGLPVLLGGGKEHQRRQTQGKSAKRRGRRPRADGVRLRPISHSRSQILHLGSHAKATPAYRRPRVACSSWVGLFGCSGSQPPISKNPKNCLSFRACKLHSGAPSSWTRSGLHPRAASGRGGARWAMC